MPPTLKVDLSARRRADPPERGVIRSRSPAIIYYGAPGAGLAVEADGADRASTSSPFPSEPDFQFGLVDEKFAGDRKDLDAPATDDDGKSTLSRSTSPTCPT